MRRSTCDRTGRLFLVSFATLFAVTLVPALRAQDPPAVQPAAEAAASRKVRRLLEPYPLTLATPTLPSAVLAGQPMTVQLQPTYTGLLRLAFTLNSGPAGMTIDADAGLLTWTPPSAAEGTQSQVSVSVTDSVFTAQTSFNIPVATTHAVATSLAGSTLTVTAGTLQSVSFTFPAGATLAPAQIAVSTVQLTTVPSLPANVTRLTDVFRLTPVSAPDGSWITLSLPHRLVPSSSQPQALRLYVWQEDADGQGNSAWLSECYSLDVLADGTVTLQIGALSGLCFIGAVSFPAASSSSAWNAEPMAASGNSVVCAPKTLKSGAQDVSSDICTVTTATLQFTAEIHTSMGLQGINNLQSDATLVAGWLADSENKLYDLGMTTSKYVAVGLEDLSDISVLALVTPVEQYQLLHLDWSQRFDNDYIKHFVANALFHQSAAATQVPEEDNLLKTATHHETDWIVEGLATWFEDEVYDGDNPYRDLRIYFRNGRLPQALRYGVAALPIFPSIPETWGPLRFSFWKDVKTTCSAFHPRDALNTTKSSDWFGLKNVADAMQSSWKCSAQGILKSAGTTELVKALLWTNEATVVNGNISLLDSDEPNIEDLFHGIDHELTPAWNCSGASTCPSSAQLAFKLPPASALSFGIIGFPFAPAGTLASFHLTSTSTVAVLTQSWVASDRSFKQADPNTPLNMSYGSSGVVPFLDVTVANPSTTDWALVGVVGMLSNPSAMSLGWSFYEPSAPGCYPWSDHVDVGISTTATLTSTIAQEPANGTTQFGQQADLTITGAVPSLPITLDITGNLTSSQLQNSSKCYDQSGGYEIMTFSNPVMRVNNATQSAPGSFEIKRTISAPLTSTCADKVTTSWDYLFNYYYANGTLSYGGGGSGVRAVLCVNYAITKQ
jgi:hypothetical protein